MSERYYEFGEFRLDAAKRLLFRGGEIVSLTAKVFDTLLVLVENHYRVVEKEELMRLVWGDTFVEEGNLTFNISMLRKTLGENPKQHKYIVTIPGRGYRFVAEVRKIGAQMAQQSEENENKQPEENTIAVLPFKPLFPSAEEDYLGLGLTDALITRLSNLKQIAVRPTSAVRMFAEGEHDTIKIGKALRVKSVVEGNFRKSGNKIRVTVQLVNVEDERPLWAEKFDETFTDIFTLEDKVAEQIATALTQRLSKEERETLAKRYTENAEAYQLYLEGRYHAGKWTSEGAMRAIACFERAIDLDTDFALPYCGWAETYAAMWFHGFLAPNEIIPKCKAAIKKALAIDDQLPEARALLAGFLCWYDWDFRAAEKEFQLALRLNPNLAGTHDWYALYLKAMGRHEEAIAENSRALELDPLSLFINASMAWAYYYAGDYKRALAQCVRAEEIEPNFGVTQWTFGVVYEQLGRFPEAIAALEKAVVLTEYSRSILASLGHAYAVAGEEKKAQRIILELEKPPPQNYIPPFEIGLIYSGLENKDKAFAWFEKAFEERSAWLAYIKVEPRLKNLRKHHRFQDLLRRIGLYKLDKPSLIRAPITQFVRKP